MENKGGSSILGDKGAYTAGKRTAYFESSLDYILNPNDPNRYYQDNNHA